MADSSVSSEDDVTTSDFVDDVVTSDFEDDVDVIEGVGETTDEVDDCDFLVSSMGDCTSRFFKPLETFTLFVSTFDVVVFELSSLFDSAGSEL